MQIFFAFPNPDKVSLKNASFTNTPKSPKSCTEVCNDHTSV